MIVTIHLYLQAQPIVLTDVRNTYQKGDLYCVMLNDGKTVHKFPVIHIFRAIEVSSSIQPAGDGQAK